MIQLLTTNNEKDITADKKQAMLNDITAIQSPALYKDGQWVCCLQKIKSYSSEEL